MFLGLLACDVGRHLEDQAPDAWRWHGKRVVLVDGSTLSMPDTPANQAAYPQPRSQRPGVGFPILRWVALLGLATGVVLDSAFGPYRGKETGESALFRTLMSSLHKGDVVLADRYYCSYWMVALLQAHETYSRDEILDLYHERWHAEIDLRSIKTQMKMEILRCKTPAMVRKEIWSHLLTYNLVRKVMAQAAAEHNLTPRQISFAGAMQTLNEFRTSLLHASAAELPEMTSRILAAIACHRVGNRPGRVEPRKVKRRPKGYSRLLNSRAEERAKLTRNRTRS
jgi:hypothetical protein